MKIWIKDTTNVTEEVAVNTTDTMIQIKDTTYVIEEVTPSTSRQKHHVINPEKEGVGVREVEFEQEGVSFC